MRQNELFLFPAFPYVLENNDCHDNLLRHQQVVVALSNSHNKGEDLLRSIYLLLIYLLFS